MVKVDGQSHQTIDQMKRKQAMAALFLPAGMRLSTGILTGIYGPNYGNFKALSAFHHIWEEVKGVIHSFTSHSMLSRSCFFSSEPPETTIPFIIILSTAAGGCKSLRHGGV